MMPRRFQNHLTYTRATEGRANSPCTLLLPAEFREDLQGILEEKDYSMSKYIRVLVRKYRGFCLSYGVPQAGGVKRRYQSTGQQLIRISFRVENDIWLELGQIAAFLGMSRCYLLVWLIRLESAGGAQQFVGGPTDSLEVYDVNYPAYMQYSERLHILQNRYERRLRLRPQHRDRLPGNLRWRYFRDRRSSAMIQHARERRARSV